jgi:hypothetical protein
MSNIVYKYPLSSCNCYNITENYSNTEGNIPTNMSVKNCNVNDPYLEYYNTKQFSAANVQPIPKEGITNINPQVYNYAKDFTPIKCNETDTCPELQWTSPDPRLVSVIRGGKSYTLSSPPIDSTVLLQNVAVDKKLDNYGQNYNTYSDINAGQILYYTDRSIEDPLFRPIFVNSAEVTGVLYKDPMGALKPTYTRKPLIQDNHIGPERDNYEGGLSWIQDSTAQREDLMSKQMNVHNQQRWMSRWANE